MNNTEAISQRLARQVFNPLEILINLVYLAKSDPGNEKNVVEYMTMAEAELGHLTKTARDLNFGPAQFLPLEIVGTERQDGKLLIVDFSDGTQGRYTPDQLARIGGKRLRSDELHLDQLDE